METVSIRHSTRIQLLLLYFLSIVIPLVFSSVQLINGTIINFLLFLTAYRYSKKELLPLLVLPSLGTILHGMLFGPYTPFLLYFLPFIWIANYFQITMYTVNRSKPWVFRIAFASTVKFLLLFLTSYIFVSLSFVPAIFLLAMGPLQLITALIGGMGAYIFQKFIYHE